MVREGRLGGRGEKTETLMLERKERKRKMSDKNGGKKQKERLNGDLCGERGFGGKSDQLGGGGTEGGEN